MKIPPFQTLLLFFLMTTVSACAQRKPAEVNTAAEQILASDSIPKTPVLDTLKTNADSEITDTSGQPEPEPAQPIVTGDCNPGFIVLANPSKDHHIFQVTGFDPGNFKCWESMWKHSIQLCGDQPSCEIIYVDASKITKTSTPPFHIDAAQLQKQGIALFTSHNARKELQGARIWGRKGKGFDYYYTPF